MKRSRNGVESSAERIGQMVAQVYVPDHSPPCVFVEYNNQVKHSGGVAQGEGREETKLVGRWQAPGLKMRIADAGGSPNP